MAPTNLEFGPSPWVLPSPVPGSQTLLTVPQTEAACQSAQPHPATAELQQQQQVQHSLGSSTGQGHLGAAVPDPSHSWWAQRSSHGTNCNSLNTKVQNNLPTQLAGPKAAEGLPSPNQQHSEGGGWGNAKMVPCIVLGCGSCAAPSRDARTHCMLCCHLKPGVISHTGWIPTNACMGVPGASCPSRHDGIIQRIFAAQKPSPVVGLLLGSESAHQCF